MAAVEQGAGAGQGAAETIAGRYRVLRELGRGGMAQVFEVEDLADGRRLALKRVRQPQRARDRLSVLFEREFHTLSELAHPRIVAVLDYHRDPAGAFYTMELLDGGDLRKRVPLPWQETCSVLRDVCSALSVLHARRLVHRDVTPRNIRCTHDGQAKLIDFGAMAAFGPCRYIVGTAPFVAPEAIYAQALDARTDLFALGATAYYALTGRHAYPARKLAELRDVWRRAPPPPSKYAPEVPPQLDALVGSLLQLPQAARPQSAAEVIERLCAIAELPVREDLGAAQAHLTMPTLVGRDAALLQVRKQVKRATRGRGGSLFVTGPAGVGRSRFLDACMLEGRLAGLTVVRIDAGDASAGEWGGVDALCRQLLRAAPDHARRAAQPCAPALANLSAELAAELAVAPHRYEDPQRRRAGMQQALRDFAFRVADQAGLLIAADDLPQLDEPSAAFVALVAADAMHRPLLVVTSAPAGDEQPAQPALRVLHEASNAIELVPLEPAQTRALLGSVFGQVPQLALVARRLHEASYGNPQAIMAMARHLLDRGVVRYRAGAFVLPERLDPSDVPPGIAAVLTSRLSGLSPGALELAAALALSHVDGLTFEACLALTTHGDPQRLMREVDALLLADVLRVNEDRYCLSMPGLRPVVLAQLPPERAERLHGRLADLLVASDPLDLRAVQHRLRAGDADRALDQLMAHCRLVPEADPRELLERVRSLPADFMNTCEILIAEQRRQGRGRDEQTELLCWALSTRSVSGQPPSAWLPELLQRLRVDVGLDIHDALDIADPVERLTRALERAQARHEQRAERERSLAPAEAIAVFGRGVISAIGVLGGSMDHAAMASVPSLRPLLPLSPALAVIESNARATAHILAGRTDQARATYLEILDQLERGPVPGLLEGTQFYMRLAIRYGVSSIEVAQGRRGALDGLVAFENDPLFAVNAWRLRMLHALHCGDGDEAERARQHAENLQLQNSPPQMFGGSWLWPLLRTHALARDLVRVGHVLPGIERMAELYPAWRQCLWYAQGARDELRGDLHGALERYEHALAQMRPGEHMVWATAAAAAVTTLLELGRAAQALEQAHAMLGEAQRHSLHNELPALRQAFAVSLARAGHAEQAVAQAELALFELRERDIAGLNLALAHAARARVALAASDEDGFRKHLLLCQQAYGMGAAPSATCGRLMHEGRRAGLAIGPEVRSSEAPPSRDELAQRDALVGSLIACLDGEQRLQRVLSLLLHDSGARGGLLYTMRDGVPVRTVAQGELSPPQELDARVRDFVDAEIEGSEAATVASTEVASQSLRETVWRFDDASVWRPFLLMHPHEGGTAITAAAVLSGAVAAELFASSSLLRTLSRALLQAGDAAPALAGEVP